MLQHNVKKLFSVAALGTKPSDKASEKKQKKDKKIEQEKERF